MDHLLELRLVFNLVLNHLQELSLVFKQLETSKEKLNGGLKETRVFQFYGRTSYTANKVT